MLIVIALAQYLYVLMKDKFSKPLLIKSKK